MEVDRSAVDRSAAVLAGVKRGLFYAAICSSWVMLAYFATDGENVRRKGVSLLPLLVAYALGLPVAGAIVGRLDHLRDTWVGRALIGMATGITIAFLVTLSMTDPLSPQDFILGSVAAGIIVGIPMALIWLRPRN